MHTPRRHSGPEHCWYADIPHLSEARCRSGGGDGHTHCTSVTGWCCACDSQRAAPWGGRPCAPHFPGVVPRQAHRSHACTVLYMDHGKVSTMTLLCSVPRCEWRSRGAARCHTPRTRVCVHQAHCCLCQVTDLVATLVTGQQHLPGRTRPSLYLVSIADEVGALVAWMWAV